MNRLDIYKFPYGSTWFIKEDKHFFSYRIYSRKDRGTLETLYKLRKAIMTKEKSKMMVRFK